MMPRQTATVFRLAIERGRDSESGTPWELDCMRVLKKCFQTVSTWFPHPSASLVLQNGYYVITAFTRIRIFEKILRIRRDTVILVKVGKKIPTENVFENL